MPELLCTSDNVSRKVSEYCAVHGVVNIPQLTDSVPGWHRAEVSDVLFRLIREGKVKRGQRAGTYQPGCTPPDKKAEVETMKAPAETGSLHDVQQIWHERPTDAELLDRAKALKAQVGYGYRKVLAKEAGVGLPTLDYWLMKARGTFPGLRKNNRVPAEPEMIPIYECDTCHDTGIVGGGDSGEPCSCQRGQDRLLQMLTDHIVNEPTVQGGAYQIIPLAARVEAQAVVSGPGVGVDTPAGHSEPHSDSVGEGGQVVRVPGILREVIERKAPVRRTDAETSGLLFQTVVQVLVEEIPDPELLQRVLRRLVAEERGAA